MTEIDELRAENARLKQEIWRLNQPFVHEGKGLVGFEGIMPDRDKAFNKWGKKILDLIEDLGEVTSEEIEQRFGIKGPMVRSCIGQHRREGRWVMGTRRGYWMGDRADVKMEIASLMGRCRSMMVTVRGLEGSLVKSQLELTLEDRREL